MACKCESIGSVKVEITTEPMTDCIYRDGGYCCDCDKAPCDHMPKFAKQHTASAKKSRSHKEAGS